VAEADPSLVDALVEQTRIGRRLRWLSAYLVVVTLLMVGLLTFAVVDSRRQTEVQVERVDALARCALQELSAHRAASQQFYDEVYADSGISPPPSRSGLAGPDSATLDLSVCNRFLKGTR
jgi:hypothetical protein